MISYWEVTNLLCNSIHCLLYMGGEVQGHDAGVNDSHVLRPVDDELAIDHSSASSGSKSRSPNGVKERLPKASMGSLQCEPCLNPHR